ncbi:MAG: 16S rRNA (cytidine(1402)-2'-O)-methyltransferase [Myxococcales bacterium]|nr:16S rRNA (cytidine(1402)-2'-O)-methyltransferase [Myxococcales bacterium]
MTATMATPGRLSVVATPIGNLDDITLRALRTLAEADLILAEDTRHTRKLLSHHGITTRQRSYHAHSGEAAVQRALGDLESGLHLALVTDAGTPLLSDPGATLVAAARQRGLRVDAVPGPCAAIAALSIAGLPFDSFRFVGFAPRTGARRRRWLEDIASRPDASVFYESPRRLGATLKDLSAELAGERRLAVCRELTKLHEEVVTGFADELAECYAEGVRGEITVVVGAGPVRAACSETETIALDEAIAARLSQGDSARNIARELAAERGLPRRRVYAAVQAQMRAAEEEE